MKKKLTTIDWFVNYSSYNCCQLPKSRLLMKIIVIIVLTTTNLPILLNVNNR